MIKVRAIFSNLNHDYDSQPVWNQRWRLDHIGFYRLTIRLKYSLEFRLAFTHLMLVHLSKIINDLFISVEKKQNDRFYILYTAFSVMFSKHQKYNQKSVLFLLYRPRPRFHFLSFITKCTRLFERTELEVSRVLNFIYDEGGS